MKREKSQAMTDAVYVLSCVNVMFNANKKFFLLSSLQHKNHHMQSQTCIEMEIWMKMKEMWMSASSQCIFAYYKFTQFSLIILTGFWYLDLFINSIK